MKKKKILHIVESFATGIYSFLADLVNENCEQYEIIIAHGKRKETPENFKKDFNEHVRFIEIKNFTRNINLKKDIKALKEIKELIKKEKPEIIHLHSSKAGILGRLAISGKKVKMLYNPHGFSFLKQDDSKLKRYIYWSIEKITAIINKRCTIVGCSNGEYLEAKKLNKNSICINNGINIEKLEEETKNFKKRDIDINNLKICTVGRICYQKNPYLFNKIATNFPNIQFTWIGDGELKDQLTSQNIKITGWKERKDVLKELNNQDVFILASLWEGLPISLLEAMFMKKICLVSNSVGNRSVIKNEVNGYMCNNLNEYVQYIEKLMKLFPYEIANNAYNDVLNVYSIKEMKKNYTDFYKNNRKI